MQQATEDIPMHKQDISAKSAIPIKKIEHNTALDGWRGVACLLVYFTHVGVSLVFMPIVMYGNSGVHMFFVLSGYLIFKPFARALIEYRPIPDLKVYLFRRCVRILPPFWVALAVYTVPRYLLHFHPPTPQLLLAHFTLTFNYFLTDHFTFINPVFWTLAIEVQFYFLLPLATLAVRYWTPVRGVRAACLVVVVFLIVGPVTRVIEFYSFPLAADDMRFHSTFAFLDMFGWGMAVAVLESSGVVAARRAVRILIFFLSLVVILVTNYFLAVESQGAWLMTENVAMISSYPLTHCLGFAGLLYLAVLGDGWMASVLRWRPLAWVGLISYSLYLYHVAVQFSCFRAVNAAHLAPWLPSYTTHHTLAGIVYGLLFLPPALLFSWLMFLLVEKPSLKAAHSRTPMRRPA